MKVVLGADGTGPIHVDTANLWSLRDATGPGRRDVALAPGLFFDRHLRQEFRDA
jgi:hypothetical protein